MAAPVQLRGDYDAGSLRPLARGSGDAGQTRRLLALAAIYDGASRTAAAWIGGVGLQTVGDWVLAFHAQGPAGLVAGKAPGHPPLLNDAQRRALMAIIEAGPIPAAPRRRALAAHRSGTMGVRGVRHRDQQADAEPDFARHGFAQAIGSPPSSCARHRGDGDVQKNFAATLEEIARRDAAGKPIEIWFQGEARIGQKNKITRRGARRGTRPGAAHDQRTRSTYIFGAICPAQGTPAGLVLPFCNTAAMALHLQEIAKAVTPGAHGVLLLDQAGWHLSGKLDIPKNLTLIPLPPQSPELNPPENIWQFMRENWLSNRIFRSYDDIVDHCCHAWNKLVDQPGTIMSIGLRDGAHRCSSVRLGITDNDAVLVIDEARRTCHGRTAL